MFKKKLLSFCVFLSYFTIISSQVVVTKNARSSNPSLLYKAFSGNRKFSKKLRNDLINSGWFNLVSNHKNADYILSGSVKNGKIKFSLSVSGSGNPVLSGKTNLISSVRRTSHKLADYILMKRFGIEGICSSRIAFTVDTGKKTKEIYTCDFDGSNIRRETANKTFSVEPDWVPGESSIVYTIYNRSSTDIAEKDLKTQRSRRLSTMPGLNSGPSVSPDKKYIAFVSSRDGILDLYIKNYGRKGIKRLSKDRYVEASPTWSPDGRKICYVSNRSGKAKLYIMNIYTGKIQRLPTVGSEAVSPDWSEDNKITYSAKMGTSYTIAVYDFNGKIPKGPVVKVAGDWETPSWAPDNRHIVCSRDVGGKTALYIVDSWTQKIRPLLGLKTKISLPSWSDIR